MATATIIAAWKDTANAYATVRVAEGGTQGNVEYGPASTPLKKDDGSAKTVPELKADLTTALKALRDAQVVPAPASVAITGIVTL